MVKNELSIRAAESYRLAKNVANNKQNKYQEMMQENISHVLKRLSFNLPENDKKIQSLRLNNLQESIDKLINESKFLADFTFFNNYRKENVLAWSFVILDKNQNHEASVKKQIALHRQDLVKIDNAIEKASFDNKWNQILKENDYKYNVEYFNALNKLYEANNQNIETSYESFYNQVSLEYQEKIKEFKNEFDPFYQIILKEIEASFEKTSFFDNKKDAFDKGNLLIDSYKNAIKVHEDLLSKEIDEAILKEQIKEHLHVEDELESCRKDILDISIKLKEIEKNIKDAKNDFEKICKIITNSPKIKYSKDESLNASQISLLEEIISIFNNKKDITKKLYFCLKNYILKNILSFEKFLDVKRKEMLPDENDTNLYNLAKMDKDSIEASKKEVNKKYHEKLESINTLHQEKLKEIKENKEKALKEYAILKEHTKTSLKIADGKKASDLKEVLKLQRSGIDVDVKDAISKERKQYQNNKKQALNEYNLVLAFNSKPEPLAIKYENKVASDKIKKQKDTETSKLNKHLRKEKSIARYRHNMNIAKRESLLGYLFLSIWAIGFIVMTLVPILYTIILSFSSVTYTNNGYPKVIDFSFKTGITFPSFVGLDNFETLFLQDINIIYSYVPQFFRSLILFVPIVVFISFVLALLLNSKIRGRTFFRVIYFLPVVIVSGPVLTMLNNSNSSGSSSIRINLTGSSVATILNSISPKLLMYANEVFQNFIIILWMTGVPIVLFISALQKINRSLYEAADIDGANGWQKLWTITFPLIKSVLLICCLYTIMQVTTINVSYVNPFTGWLDNNISDMTVNKGYVALAAWTQTIIVLLFVLVSFLLFREKEFVVKQKSYEEYEAIKKKKEQRKAKIRSFFHIIEIKNFFSKLVSPITKIIKVNKSKKELGGK